MHPGSLYIVSAPSGGGKSSLIKALLQRFNNDDSLRLSISYTTRPPRPGEVNHVHYHFVSEAEFQDLIARHAFYEYATVFNYHYGTSREIVEQWIAQGKDVLFDIDWQGARQLRSQIPDACTIFILPPSLQELRSRLEKRSQDSEEVISRRMQQAVSEISHYPEYSYIITNDNFDESLLILHSIILSKRAELKTREAELAEYFDKIQTAPSYVAINLKI